MTSGCCTQKTQHTSLQTGREREVVEEEGRGEVGKKK
jgi:hypothetical protein